jgi:hypothetical protein
MKKEYFEVMLEQLDDRMQAIGEYVSLIPSMQDRLVRVEEKVDRIENRMIVLESVVREHSVEIKQLTLMAHSHS